MKSENLTPFEQDLEKELELEKMYAEEELDILSLDLPKYGVPEHFTVDLIKEPDILISNRTNFYISFKDFLADYSNPVLYDLVLEFELSEEILSEISDKNHDIINIITYRDTVFYTRNIIELYFKSLVFDKKITLTGSVLKLPLMLNGTAIEEYFPVFLKMSQGLRFITGTGMVESVKLSGWVKTLSQINHYPNSYHDFLRLRTDIFNIDAHIQYKYVPELGFFWKKDPKIKKVYCFVDGVEKEEKSPIEFELLGEGYHYLSFIPGITTWDQVKHFLRKGHVPYYKKNYYHKRYQITFDTSVSFPYYNVELGTYAAKMKNYLRDHEE